MSEENLEVREPEAFVPKPKKEKPSPAPFPGIRVEEASAPLTLQEPAPDGRGPWIQYNGIATLRIMDAEAWRSAGVNSTKYIEWNFLNKMRVPVSEFTEAELSYLLGRDGRFSKVQ